MDTLPKGKVQLIMSINFSYAAVYAEQHSLIADIIPKQLTDNGYVALAKQSCCKDIGLAWCVINDVMESSSTEESSKTL